jgi:hypothetical protein
MTSGRYILAADGVTGLSVGAVSQLRLGPVELWTPRPDTWPLRRYDSANTATNLDAIPPTNPSVAWAAAPLGVSRGNAVVADQETVYAAGNGTAALDRTDGTVRWRSNHSGGPLAVREGTVFIAPGYDVPAEGVTLRAVRTDGVERWSQRLVPENEPPTRIRPSPTTPSSSAGKGCYVPTGAFDDYVRSTGRSSPRRETDKSSHSGDGQQSITSRRIGIIEVAFPGTFVTDSPRVRGGM